MIEELDSQQWNRAFCIEGERSMTGEQLRDNDNQDVELFTCPLQDGWLLSVIESEGEVDVWLTRSKTPGTPYGLHFDDRLPFDLAALGFTPVLRFDDQNRPYVIWPCGRSVLIWRCAQRTHLWVAPHVEWSEARAP